MANVWLPDWMNIWSLSLLVRLPVRPLFSENVSTEWDDLLHARLCSNSNAERFGNAKQFQPVLTVAI